MTEKIQNKSAIYIISILSIVCVIELVLLIKSGNSELQGNNKETNRINEINYDDEMKLGDVLFDSENVRYDNTTSGLSSTNVKAAIDELYTASNTCVTNLGTCNSNYSTCNSNLSTCNSQKSTCQSNLSTCQTNLATAQAQIPPTCSNSPFQVGDYIDMTPTATTFTPNTTYTGYNSTQSAMNPSELNVWRVIKINSDCTVEVVSEYVSSVNVYFRDKVGYMNYIWYLNEIAKQYANTTYTLNPSTAPTGAFRNVGYDKEKQTAKITDSTRIDDTTLGASGGAWYQKTTSLNKEESKGGGDDGFTKYLNLLSDAGVSLVAYKKNTTTATSYWLASRLFSWNSASNWYFGARYVNNNGRVGYSSLYYWNNSSFNAYSDYYAVRPIITLKSGLTTSSGNGTSSSHYQLSVS